MIHIKPRDFSLNNFNDLDNEIYCAYSKYWEYYAQDSKKKLQNFIDFIGIEIRNFKEEKLKNILKLKDQFL